MVPAHYDIITVGMAPGGMVVIWLSGNKSRVEICRLQAKETFVDKDKFRPIAKAGETQEQFFDTKFKIAVPDSIQAEIEKNGIPFKLWDDYRIRYKYRFVVNAYDDKDKVTGVHNLQYSGEEDFITEISDAEKYRDQGIPYNVTVEFTKYFVNIIFDDRETLSVFEELQKKYPGKPIDIVLTPTFMYKDIKVSVKCEDEEIKLQKYKMDGVYGG